jgi:hypothetical protein
VWRSATWDAALSAYVALLRTGLCAASLVQASDFEIRNDSDQAVYFSIADHALECPPLYFRDHNWIGVLPGEIAHVDIETDDSFFIGAMSLDLDGGRHFVAPLAYGDPGYDWTVPFEGSSNGQCSQLQANDGANPSSFPHALIPPDDFEDCERPGAQAINVGGAVGMSVVCW